MNDCEQLRELIPAYSIGATDADETRLVEDGLSRCPELVEELEHYAQLNQLIADSLPMINPPADMLGHLLISAKKTRHNRIRQPQWVLITVASLLLVLILTNIYWATRFNTQLVKEIRLNTVVSEGISNVGCRIVWLPESNHPILIASNFPLIGEDKTYQIWGRRGESVSSLGLFYVDANGNGSVALPPDLQIESFDSIGITVEPHGGSLVPTSESLVRWKSS